MFTDSSNPALLFAFVAILLPSTGLFIRYTWLTRFWANPAGRAFFLIIATSWANYVVSAVSLHWGEWATGDTGTVLRVVSRLLIAAAIAYAWYVFEQSRHRGANHSGFTGDRRTPSGGIKQTGL